MVPNDYNNNIVSYIIIIISYLYFNKKLAYLLNCLTMQLESLTSEGYTFSGSSERNRARGDSCCA